jgi:hypothetical protein
MPQAFTYTLVRRIRKLVDQANNRGISREPLIQNVFWSHVSRKRSGTQYVDPIIENFDMNVIDYAVVAMQHTVCYNLMNRCLGIGNIRKAFRRPYPN